MANSKKPPKKKAPTKQHTEYMKQRRRIQRIVSEAKKSGYHFTSNPLPDIPEKITAADIRALKIMTPERVRAHAIQTISKTDPRYKAPPRSQKVLRTIEEIIDKFSPVGARTEKEKDRQIKRHGIIKNLLETQIMLNGRAAVAKRLQETSADVERLIERMIYGDSDEEEFQIDLGWFAQIIKGDMLSADEAIEIRDLIDEYDG